MLTLTINKQTMKASVAFDGKEQDLSIVDPKKESLKAGTRWVNMKSLGTPRQWVTVNFEDNKEDIFTVEVDENQARQARKAISRLISMSNFKDFLVEDADKELFDGLFAKAEVERDRQIEEAKKNAPAKESKSRKKTPEEKLAEKKAEMEILEKIINGELPADYLEQQKKAKSKAKSKKAPVENLDEDVDAEADAE